MINYCLSDDDYVKHWGIGHINDNWVGVIVKKFNLIV